MAQWLTEPVSTDGQQLDLGQVVTNLAERFPHSPPESLWAAAEQARSRFSRATVRGFLEVLIEREARASLRDGSR